MGRKRARTEAQLAAELELLGQIKAESVPAKRQRLIGELLTVGQWVAQIRGVVAQFGCARAEEDLAQAGLQGLLEAVSRYDAGLALSELGHGEGWVSYAYSWIRRRIGEQAARSGAIVRETQWEQRAAKRDGRERRAQAWSGLETVAARAAVAVEPTSERAERLAAVLRADGALAEAVRHGEDEAMAEARDRVLAAERVAREGGRLAAAINRRCAELDRAEQQRREVYAGRWARLLADMAAA